MERRRSACRSIARAALLLSLVVAFQTVDAQPPPGTRIVHYSGVASIPGSRLQLVGNVNGGFILRSTGQRVSIETVAGAGGHGYTIVDIVYADGEVCVGSLTSLGMDGLTGALAVLGYSGFATRGTCSDFWQPPAQLSALQPQLGDVTIAHGQLDFAGTTLQTVGISVASSNATSNSVYDLATGLLIFGDTASDGGPVLTPGPGGVVTPGAGTTHLTHSQLQMARPLPLPNVSDTLPQHVRDASALNYDCYTSMTFMGTSVGLRCTHEVRVVAGGAGWLSLGIVQTTEEPLTGVPTVSEYQYVLAAKQLLGYYLSPEIAAGLAPGALLDEDPVSGARTWVVHADARVVVLEFSLPLESSRYVYDRASGWLIEVVRTQQLGGGVTETSMQLVNVR